MKTRKTYLLILVSIALLSACSDDKTILGDEQSRDINLPDLIATVDEGSHITKAGVQEDEDYTLGEKFYWMNNDEVYVALLEPDASALDLTKYGISYIGYRAVVENNEKKNTASFTSYTYTNMPQPIKATYQGFGLFPSSAWTIESNKAPTVSIQNNQRQNMNNSKHLAIIMKSDKKTLPFVPENDKVTDNWHLNFKHLSSVFRFAVWNSSTKSSLRVLTLTAKVRSGKKCFVTKAELPTFASDTLQCSPDDIEKVSSIGLTMQSTSGQFSPKNGKQQWEGYISVLPTAGTHNQVHCPRFDPDDYLDISMLVIDDSNYKIYKVTNSLQFGTDLPFLVNSVNHKGLSGIVQGESYYFRLKISDANLIPN